MAFSSMVFLWMFLPAALLVFWVIPSEKWKKCWLLCSSLLFYCWSDTRAFPLFCLFILVNWILGRHVRGRKGLLAAGLLLDVDLLCYYKYFPGAGPMPSGLSFYTFLGVSYLADCYKGEAEDRGLLSTALYFSFFPKVTSGPLVRYADFCGESGTGPSEERTAYGVRRFILGFAKKAVISDQLAPAVSGLFLMDITTAPTLYMWAAVLLYAIQIYYDFSGYTDMAVGLGVIFGYALPENFDHPYASLSMTDFWRRWHMTLSRWFRDYIYIPLGGNRKGLVRTCLNLGAVYLVTGIWHGSGLCYLAWGIWNGAFVILERIFLKEYLEKLPAWIRHVYTLFVVLIGWVFFRAGSLTRALQMLVSMFAYRAGDALPIRMFAGPGTWAIFLIGVLFAFPRFPGAVSRFFSSERKWVRAAETAGLILIFLVAILFVASGSYTSFIYFQF